MKNIKNLDEILIEYLDERVESSKENIRNDHNNDLVQSVYETGRMSAYNDLLEYLSQEREKITIKK